MAHHFIDRHLLKALGTSETAKCARCVILADGSTDTFSCNCCKEVKPTRGNSALACNRYKLGERRVQYWKCFTCQYPACTAAGCGKRPGCLVSHNHFEKDGSCFCHAHHTLLAWAAASLHRRRAAYMVGSSSRNGFAMGARRTKSQRPAIRLQAHRRTKQKQSFRILHDLS